MEHHQGVTQEVLFRTLATFQTALQRQVWESVEIDSTTNSIGFQACLNHKTEWGSSKDPALVPRRSPLTKSFAKAQKEGQVAGNTTKRSRMAEQQEQGRPNKARKTGPGPEAAPTPKRNKRQRQSRQTSNQPTESELQGPIMKALRGENTPRPPYQGREGPGRAGSAIRRIPQDRGRPPE